MRRLDAPLAERWSCSITRFRGFRAGTPVRLFKSIVSGPFGAGHRLPYAVSEDGQRFLMYVNDCNAPPPSISVIINWPALLEQ